MQNVFSKKFLPNGFAGVLNKKANAVTDKLQIPNPKQISNLNFYPDCWLLEFGICLGFGIWDLGFRKTIIHTSATQSGPSWPLCMPDTCQKRFRRSNKSPVRSR